MNSILKARIAKISNSRRELVSYLMAKGFSADQAEYQVSEWTGQKSPNPRGWEFAETSVEFNTQSLDAGH